MDRTNRSELAKTVEEQQKKLVKYEAKLRDLIGAYKGLLKEKEALEASVKILSSASPASEGQNEEEKARGKQTSDPLGVEQGEGGDSCTDNSQEDIMRLKSKLGTLTNSLATVSQEKSKMEANYQAEKRKLKQEYEAELAELKGSREQNEDLVQELSAKVKELKSKLIIHQHERDKEQTDHAVMLKELQKLVADERNAKEHLQLQLEETQQILSENQQTPIQDPLSEQQKKKIEDQSKEIAALKLKLKQVEEKANQPSPELLKLQKEMAELKAEHRISYEREQLRASEAEDRALMQSSESETRVASLESKVSELSELVGNYEKLRCQDQQNIQRLRERVTQLDLENTALAKAANTSSDYDASEEENMDVQALVDKITRLKGLLKLANERSEKPINIEELLRSGDVTLETSSGQQQHLQEEYLQLKEEFERYKLRAQSVLKHKSHKETPKEVETLKTQVAELREKLREVHLQRDEADAHHQVELGEVRKAMTVLQERQRMEIAALEADHRQKISDLELQIRKHRERTVSLLVEKDREIAALKANSPEQLESDYFKTYRQLSTSSADAESADASGASSEETSAINQLLSKSNVLGGIQGETALLHFAQEQARKDVEIKSLRKQKLSLESALRELQISSTTKQQKLSDDIDILKEEVRKHERNQSRESANLEYLKNVVYQYLVCNDWTGKEHMLNAISTILEFSPAERKQVHDILYQGWLGYYSRSYSPGKHK